MRPYVPVVFFSAFVLGSAGGGKWQGRGRLADVNIINS